LANFQWLIEAKQAKAMPAAIQAMICHIEHAYGHC
jgi:hypothetical protein